MDAPFPGGGVSRGGRSGSVDLFLPPSEHHHTVYRDRDHYGPVSGCGVVPRSSVIKVTVVTGRTRYRGDRGGGLGDGGRNIIEGVDGRVGIGRDV